MFGYCVGVLKSPVLAGRPVLGDLHVHLKLSSNSNHIIYMIINCSLHGYIWPCRLHIGTFFCWHQNLVRDQKTLKAEIIKESWDIPPNRLTGSPTESTNKMMSSPQENGPYRQKQQDMKQGNTSSSIEGKDWSPSYLKLGSFVFYSKLCDRSCSTRTRSQALGINIEPRLL